MRPFIKWAGGKTQLLNELLPMKPEEYKNYYEPFIGGGALFFNIEPEAAVINDTNEQLINCYKQIRDNKDKLLKQLKKLQDNFNKLNTDEERAIYFYDIREKYNKKIINNKLDYVAAAHLIFLNKSCYNGLYRVNQRGLFNVPFGKKKSLNMYDKDNINEIAEILKNTNILSGDFTAACRTASKKDFVFFDSPYYNTFDTYQSGGFTVEDHVRLSELYKTLNKKGVYLMLTNSNTDFIKSLYKDFNIKTISVKRMINSNAAGRTGEEVIITNY